MRTVLLEITVVIPSAAWSQACGTVRIYDGKTLQCPRTALFCIDRYKIVSFGFTEWYKQEDAVLDMNNHDNDTITSNLVRRRIFPGLEPTLLSIAMIQRADDCCQARNSTVSTPVQ